MRLRRSPEASLAAPSQALIAAAVLAVIAASTHAQRQFDELRRHGLPANAGNTFAVALGDVDGDGDLDVILGNNGAQENELYLNNGDGKYTNATAGRLPAQRSRTRALALGDVDGDGDLDLVVGSGNRDPNRLYLNDGNGFFTDVTATRLPADNDDTRALALGDVDGDGDLDIVWGSSGGALGAGEQNRLYLNDGTGTYTDATAARLPQLTDHTQAVALGDVDGDGDLDIITANALMSLQNRLYLNDGTGTYTDATAARMPADVDATQAVAFGDVDADGDLDVVFGNGYGQQNRVYLNNGSGSFADATPGRMPVDTDSTAAIALGDIDGDGDLDLVLGNTGSNAYGCLPGQQNRVYRNDGSGSYVDATAGRLPVDSDPTHAVVLGDVDADGDLDAVLGNVCGQQNHLYLNDGSGSYAVAAGRVPFELDATTAVALGDVDADGDLDMIVGNSGQQNRLYLNDGAGHYTDVTATRMPADNDYTNAVALGDVDADGDLDLVLGNTSISYYYARSQNRLYLNNGSGSYTDATGARMPQDVDDTQAIALVDVDADGDLDIVFGNDGPNRLYLNDGTGRYSVATTAQMPFDLDWTTAVAIGDLDGDGDLDIVFGNSGHVSGGQNRQYLNDGTGTFRYVGGAYMPRISDWTTAVAIGDVDADGDLDLVFGNDFGQQNRLYLNDGSAFFTDVTATRMPQIMDGTRAVAIGDVDADGDLDLVLGNRQNRLYLNDGAGTYADVTAARMPADKDSTNAVALGDVDADGDLDVVFGNAGLNRLYLSLLRQLDPPHLLRAGHGYTLEAYARYGPTSLFDVALPMLSTATANIPVPPFGTLGLAPAQTVTAAPFLIPQPAGVGSVTFTVPAAPGLVGTWLYAQALLVPYPFPARLTNVTADQLIQ